MQSWKILGVILPALYHIAEAGSSCPSYNAIRPCFCTRTSESQTFIICAGLRNSTELQKVTEGMKSMIIDRFMLLRSFNKNDELFEDEENYIEEPDNSTNPSRLPKDWLDSVRVKELEIQDTYLPNSFMRDGPFTGQNDYLINLSVRYSSLQGHLCNSCNTKISHIATRELIKTPKLVNIDLSYNHIKYISGLAFPSELRKLSKIVLSNNEISVIYDKAFENLPSITELDLSHNKLTKFSRKIFKSDERSLKSLDLSWNSIQFLSPNSFEKMPSLRELKLAHNLLDVLPVETWTKLPALMERIDLNGNFLVCNCSLSWISKSLSKATKFIGKCVSPKEMEFQDAKASLAAVRCN